MRRRFISKTNKKSYLTIYALEDGLTASLSDNACEYCINGDGNWLSLSAGSTTESINTGQTLLFRGNLTPNGYMGIGTFTISKKCNLEGNCMSMLFGDNAANNHSLIGKSYAFFKLFKNCTNIVNVSDNFLPATTLANSCYKCMFQGCTSLTTAPELPATTLANSCYQIMFEECTSLTTAPTILPATTLVNDCYYAMFENCTSLTTAPELPATTLVSECYYCMFYGCTKLNYIKMLATDISTYGCLLLWVGGVASSGTFVKNPAMTSLPTGDSGIPEGWTVVNDGEESGGGKKIVNKLSYSIGSRDRVKFTFQYPVESDVEIYFVEGANGQETIDPRKISKGSDSSTLSVGPYIENNTITITRIVPNEDSTYIYTWKNQITFTIDGTEYQAEEGMTWEEWIDSEYNTNGYRVFFGAVYDSNGMYCIVNYYTPVGIGEEIRPNVQYSLSLEDSPN